MVEGSEPKKDPVDDANEPVILTNEEILILHRANQKRLASLEWELRELKTGTEELVEWTRNGKLGAKIARKFLVGLGITGGWLIKVIGSCTILWAMFQSIRSGKLPDFRFGQW